MGDGDEETGMERRGSRQNCHPTTQWLVVVRVNDQVKGSRGLPHPRLGRQYDGAAVRVGGE